MQTETYYERMETRKDFDTFLSLYQGLKNRYYDTPGKSEDFEIDYFHESHWINRFIREWEGKELMRMPRGIMNFAVRELAKMEKDLNTLKNESERMESLIREHRAVKTLVQRV